MINISRVRCICLPLLCRGPGRRFVSAMPFSDTHLESLMNREKFWNDAAKDISWFTPFSRVYDGSNSPFEKWFVGGELNTCYNAIDRHIENGRGSCPALIYDSPVTQSITSFTFSEIKERVMRVAGILKGMGVGRGDTVVIYLPMIPEAVVAMLACARIGAVHSVVFGGFAAPELAIRIKDCKPKVVLSTSCGIEGDKIIPYKPLVDEALQLSEHIHTVAHTVILQRPQHECSMVDGRDVDWATSEASAQCVRDCTPMKSEDPLYVLYTSGTTGKPKGVVRDTGGHAVALHWSMKNAFGMDTGDVWWAASDVGWVVGHSFTVYAPLLRGCTSVVYEGKPVGTPDAAAFWRVIEQHKVCGMFTAPTAIRAIKRQDTEGLLPSLYDLSTLRTVFVAGERADPATLKWVENHVKVPVRDNWWQTETGWPIAANLVGLEGYLPPKHGSVYRPVPGYDLRVVDDDGLEVTAGKLGQLVAKCPLPPGTLQTLYRNDARFLESYMTAVPGYYDTGDAGFIDDDGYVHVMARTDDVINVAGHRLSSGGMEEVLCDHPDIAEAVVVGMRDDIKGQIPLGLAILNSSCKKAVEEVEKEVVGMVRDRIGAVACFKRLVIVDRFPKTRSGKVTRNIIRKIADGLEYTVPATVEDPCVYQELETIIHRERHIAK